MTRASKGGSSKEPYDFREDLLAFLRGGTLSIAFYEKLMRLVRDKLPRQQFKPRLFGIVAEKWNEEAYRELALDFLTEFLMPEGGSRWSAVLEIVDRGSESVDALFVLMFRQFRSEAVCRRFPMRANLRKRVRLLLDELTREGGIVRHPSGTGFRLAGSSDEGFVEMDALRHAAQQLSGWDPIQYDGEERVAPLISQKDLKRVISELVGTVDGWVREAVLLDLLYEILPVEDARWEGLEGTGSDDPPWESQAVAMDHFQESEHEARLHLREAWERLGPRQRQVLALQGQGMSVHEICARLGLSKSVVYEDLEKGLRILRGEEPAEKRAGSPFQKKRKREL